MPRASSPANSSPASVISRPSPRGWNSPVIRKGLLLALLLVFVLELALSIRWQSQTYDEGFHLAAGYRYWQCGDFGINSEHPPMLKFVAAAPLWLGHVKAPPGSCGREPTTKDYGYALGLKFLYGPWRDANAMLYHARLAVGIFALILAIAVYLGGRMMFGESAGLVALAILVFEPTVLALGVIITTDAAVSAFDLAAVLAVYAYWTKPGPRRLIVAGVLAGLALASKHSGVLIIPVVILLSAVELVRNRVGSANPGAIGRQVVRYAATTVVILLIALAVLWTTYGLHYLPRPAGEPMTVSLSQFIANTREQGADSFLLTAVTWASRFHLVPEAYLYGFVDVVNVSEPGQPPFLLGKLYPHGEWFYFPTIFFLKSTLGFLVLFFLSLLAVRWRKLGRGRELVYLLLPPVIFVAAAMHSGLNIGYRHVLPIAGFFCILIGGGCVQLWQRSQAWRVAIAVLIVVHAASSLHSYPDYLPYVNEAFGGTYRSYRVLTDSNVDWGQGMERARRYLAGQGITDCWMAYDGAVSAEYYGVPCRQIAPNVGGAPAMPPLRANGVFVISALTLSGIEWEPGELNPYHDFMIAKPKANITGAMLVYDGDFDLSGVAAVTHIARANNEAASNPAQAVEDARAAVALTPDSVRAHLALGRALAASHDGAGAAVEFRKTLELAEAKRDFYPLEIIAARHELEKVEK